MKEKKLIKTNGINHFYNNNNIHKFIDLPTGCRGFFPHLFWCNFPLSFLGESITLLHTDFILINKTHCSQETTRKCSSLEVKLFLSMKRVSNIELEKYFLKKRKSKLALHERVCCPYE